ncbi:BatD family protein [Pseudoalteromonas tunicata]|uniref:BatD family protein n=1 Tax=Pseudoalteromonas tunicata TaxID=314281 RepID=UPI00273E77FC|nr:BatD family protein [Pseudoalteromonas tunicata]MDP4985511.1 BatD family protein [Pseudoalteromonas tunicata]
MVMRCILLLLLICSHNVFALTRLDSSVSQNPVLQGEFFVLTLQADDSVQGDQPDTSALLKDFVVGPTSVSNHTSIINGSISKKTTWQIELMSRKSGQFTIPAFTLKGVQSQPYTLSVVAQDTTKQGDDIYIETSLKPESLYVQQAGVYNVKLFLAKELRDGQLSSPMMDNAQISQLGKQVESTEIINGKRYLVVSRDYLVQPQKSGEFTITAPAFNGRIQENYRAIAASAIAEDTKLTVKPMPANYQGDWLPSELVSLHEQWQPEENTVEVGTPITRTITLTALGITKEQLPKIVTPEIEGIRSYPDQADNNHSVRDGRVISQRVESFALLPQKPGTYTLPEVKIPWFNTVVNRIEYATLPTRTITVTGTGQEPIKTPINTLETASSTIPPVQPSVMGSDPTNWLLVSSGYILWLVTLVIVWLKRSKTSAASKEVAEPTADNEQTVLKQLNQAARDKNNHLFYQLLLQLIKVRYGAEQANLSSFVESYQSPELASLVSQLQASLYSSEKGAVDLTALLKLLKQVPTSKTHTAAKLKPLY